MRLLNNSLFQTFLSCRRRDCSSARATRRFSLSNRDIAPQSAACFQSERGVALILVVFVVALASILVLNLAYSTFIGSRLNVATVHSLQAEYLLKSAINFARVLIKSDTTAEDAPQDSWGMFSNGAAVPLEMLGINQPNTHIELEIRPEESKIPLRALVPISGGDPDLKWRGVLTRLMKNLGFDDDQEEDQTNLFPGRHFTSEELVANLIDYMDQNKESYNPGDFASGIEGDLPEDTFPNTRITRLTELKAIPGFTPARVRKLEPLLTVFGNNRVNINLAPSVVLKALNEDMGDQEVEAISEFRKGDSGPFTFENQKVKLSEIIGESLYDKINTMIGVESRWFQVLSKVDYATSTYFMRAFLSKEKAGELPEIRSVELF